MAEDEEREWVGREPHHQDWSQALYRDAGKRQGFQQLHLLAQGASLPQEPSNSEPEAFLLGGQAGASSSPAGWGRLRLALSRVQGDGHLSDETWVEAGLPRLQPSPHRCGSQSQGSVVCPEAGLKNAPGFFPPFPPSFRKPSVTSCKQGSGL